MPDHTFRMLVREYATCQDAIRLQLQCMDDLACWACHPHPHSAHVDGNHKLYTWMRSHSSLEMSELAERLFEPMDKTVKHLRQLDEAAGRVGADGALQRAGEVRHLPLATSAACVCITSVHGSACQQ